MKDTPRLSWESMSGLEAHAVRERVRDQAP